MKSREPFCIIWASEKGLDQITDRDRIFEFNISHSVAIIVNTDGLSRPVAESNILTHAFKDDDDKTAKLQLYVNISTAITDQGDFHGHKQK